MPRLDFGRLIPKLPKGERRPLPRGMPPAKNVVSSEVVFAQLREEIEKNPTLGEHMTPEQRKRIGLKD